MNGRIHLVALGEEVALETLDALAAALARTLRISCRVLTEPVNMHFAWDVTRCQYYSTMILERLAALAAPDMPEIKLLGVTGADLFVPVLTFVFGEAQMPGRAAVVSCHRLKEEFYGLDARPELESARLLKEALHELGHTFGLRHCMDWRCAMASTHSVERLDLKENGYCPKCRERLGLE